MPHSTHNPGPQTQTLKPMMDNQISLHTSGEKFPDLYPDVKADSSSHTSPSRANGYPTYNLPPPDRWQSKGSPWGNGQASTGRGHARQKSLSEAVRTIRTRKGSVSANVHEISDALKAPVSPRLIILCIIWYFSSALTNTSSKSILNAFPKPATLTLIQFAFVALYCMFFAWLSSMFPLLKNNIPSLRHGIRPPTREVIITTLPLAAFQIGGHLLSSTATAKIPVSLVHTIKGLSPLFTVFAYRLVFDIRYPVATYLSLIPLTLGVMLACSASFHANILGILYALLAALIFVTQNIFSKRLFNEAVIAESISGVSSRKLDKLNLLCYSSGLAFMITSPIWFWTEGIGLFRDFFHDYTLDLSPTPSAFDHGRLALEFLFNGTFHFAQNILAFVLLSMVSPVTYSVASLIKRVFVVVIAIFWFQNPTTKIQGIGIGLTFLGLYLYDRTKEGNKADRKAKLLDVTATPVLPLHANSPTIKGREGMREGMMGNGFSFSHTPKTIVEEGERKKDDDFQDGRERWSPGGMFSPLGAQPERNVSAGGSGSALRRMSNAGWLPPGTRQEETWRPRELDREGGGVTVS